MLYKNFLRKKCIVCSSNINKLKIFKNFPTHMCCLDKDEESYFDMEWGSCQSCGCVQLLKLINQDDLYKYPHNASIGKTWEIHNSEFSKIIKNFNFRNIIEIGGANLKIANLILENQDIEKYIVIDYSSEKYEVKNTNKKLIMMTGNAEKIVLPEKCDCVIMSHTFEHLYNPTKFLKNIKKNIKTGGKFIISVPNIKNQLLDGFLNAINFEHTYYIDDFYIKKIFNNAGFILKNIIEFSKYNFFYVFEKTNKIIKDDIILFSEPTDIFNNFYNNTKNEVAKINSIVNNKKFYVFGAHVFTQYLINFGLNKDNIINILDNDNTKINKYLFGTNILIKSPDILKYIDNQNVILRAGQYTEEIKKQLLLINSSINII